MANENKTRPTAGSVSAFLNALENETRRRDAKTVLAMLKRVTGLKPRMWGGSIVGFGKYAYRTDAGREGEWAMIGFSPRKANLVVYIMQGLAAYESILERLGPYKTGKSCLYLTSLERIDTAVLEELAAASFTDMTAKYGVSDA